MAGQAGQLYNILDSEVFNMWMENLNCDGSGKHSGGAVKRYPTGGDGAAILCISCWVRENRFNYERARDSGEPEKWPQRDWDKTEAYNPE